MEEYKLNKINLKNIWCADMNCINLAQDIF